MKLTSEERDRRIKNRQEQYKLARQRFPQAVLRSSWGKSNGYSTECVICLPEGKVPDFLVSLTAGKGNEIRAELQAHDPVQLGKFIHALVLRYNRMVEEMNAHAGQCIMTKAAHAATEAANGTPH